MAESKLTRKLLKQFASTAPASEIDVFGSLAAAALATSTDPDTIQSLSAWLDGWAAEVLANDSPVLEDRNAVDFVYSYMMKTIFQMGIPEWLTTETYFVGSIVNSAGVLYKSRVNSNIGHAVTDRNYWVPYNPGNGLNPQASARVAARCLGLFSEVSYDESGFVGASICYAPEIDTWLIGGLADVGTPTHIFQYSTDGGDTWTHAVGASAKWIQAVAWSPELGLFAAGSANGASTGAMMSSADGITWTAHDSPVAGSIYGMIWVPALGLYVAVGATTAPAALVLTSPDGLTWTQRTAAAGDQLNAVCYSEKLGLLVAVGSAFGGTKVIHTSPDGINWTARTPVASSEPANVVWCEELEVFVAVGSITFVPPAVTAQYSYDGITWQALTIPSPAANSVPLGLCWIPELGELAIGYSEVAGATNNIYFTRDLVNFTATVKAGMENTQRIAWSPQRAQAISVGNYTGKAVRSRFVQHFIVPNTTP